MTAIAVPAPARRGGTDAALTWRWILARVRMMLRSPRTLGFTFAFPLVLVVLFNAINGDVKVASMGPAGGDVTFAQYYTPSIGVFSLTIACYTSLLIGLATARENGLLKRVRGTPLPMPVYLGSWLTGAALTGIASVVLMFAVAIPVFGVEIYPRLLPAAIVTLVLGAVTLSALGLAVASLVGSAEQAMPIAQVTFLPLSFISGIWYPLDGAPDWITTIAHIFPLYHLVNAFDACFVPQTTGGGWSPTDLAVLAAWAVGATFVAVRRFHAEPATGEGGGLRARFA
jgi:ABC-2 type transport system permease protein